MGDFKIPAIAVTGANGELGGILLRSLLRRGYATRALVRSDKAAKRLAEIFKSRRLDVRRVNYADKSSLAAALQGCSVVIHLVGILKETRTSSYAEAHEASASALLSAATQENLGRIIALSILGADSKHVNPCLSSRGRSDDLLVNARLPCLVLRVPMVLARGNKAARLLYKQASNRVTPLLAGGHTREQPLDARDLIETLIIAAKSVTPKTGIFELAGPESLSQRSLVERASALIGFHPRILPVPIALIRPFAAAAESLLIDPPFTRPMLEVLSRDDCIDPVPTCTFLRTTLRPLDNTLHHVLLPEL